MTACWHKTPAQRPSFPDLVPRFEALLRQLREQELAPIATGVVQADNRPSGGFFSKFRAKQGPL
jgi:hypothetical protein